MDTHVFLLCRKEKQKKSELGYHRINKVEDELMVSREFIRSVVRAHHAIAVHMKGEERWDGLTNLIYVIHDLILDEDEEKLLIMNTINRVDTYGLLKVKALRTSEVDASLQDAEPQEYIIDTMNIVEYETVNN